MPADSYLLAWTGPAWNGKTVDYSDRDFDGSSYSAALKHSGALTGFTSRVRKAIGGRDACVDVNNFCRNLDITVGELWPTGQFAATIKGNSTGIRLRGRLMRHAQKFDVIIGEWSDQSNQPTTGVSLGLIPDDGQPVVVCVLAGEKPVEEPGTGPYVYRFPSPDMPGHGVAVWGFQTLRRWGFWRKESNDA